MILTNSVAIDEIYKAVQFRKGSRGNGLCMDPAENDLYANAYGIHL